MEWVAGNLASFWDWVVLTPAQSVPGIIFVLMFIEYVFRPLRLTYIRLRRIPPEHLIEAEVRQCEEFGLEALERGDFKAAERFHDHILKLQKKLGQACNRGSIATAYGRLGLVALERGELGAAEELLLKALHIEEGLGHTPETAEIFSRLGRVALARGDLDTAESWFQKSLTLNTDLSNTKGVAIQYGNLGLIASKRNDLEIACALWSRSLDLFQQAGAPSHIGQLADWMREAGCPNAPKED